MKDYLREIVRSSPDPTQALNVVREYLQARVLAALQRSGALIPLAFQGGTALRFLFATARYSEDLDFALEKNKAAYNFRAYLQSIKSELTAEGYAVGIKVSDKKVVHSAFIRCEGLPFELGLSPHRGQTLSVKIEVDTNPPQGARLATSVVRRHVTLQLQHHDRASLLAGKIHAILQRPYVKGRDVYDLVWYLSDPRWPAPNLILLNNALQQTGWRGKPLTENTWAAAVAKRLRTLAWEHVVDDVRPFLEPSVNPNILTQENLKRLLREWAKSEERRV